MMEKNRDKKDIDSASSESESNIDLLSADEKPKGQKIAIFMKNWIETSRIDPGFPNQYIKSWKSMTIVFDQECIEKLISDNAPIRIFREDVN